MADHDNNSSETGSQRSTSGNPTEPRSPDETPFQHTGYASTNETSQFESDLASTDFDSEVGGEDDKNYDIDGVDVDQTTYRETRSFMEEIEEIPVEGRISGEYSGQVRMGSPEERNFSSNEWGKATSTITSEKPPSPITGDNADAPLLGNPEVRGYQMSGLSEGSSYSEIVSGAGVFGSVGGFERRELNTFEERDVVTYGKDDLLGTTRISDTASNDVTEDIEATAETTTAVSESMGDDSVLEDVESSGKPSIGSPVYIVDVELVEVEKEEEEDEEEDDDEEDGDEDGDAEEEEEDEEEEKIEEDERRGVGEEKEVRSFATYTQVTVETSYDTTGPHLTETLLDSAVHKTEIVSEPNKFYESVSSGITEYTVRILPGGIVEKSMENKDQIGEERMEDIPEEQYEKISPERKKQKQRQYNHLIQLGEKKMKKNLQIRTLTVHKGENTDTSLFRLENEWILRFVLGPSLHADVVRIFTNHPESRKQPFKRDEYHELHWESPCSTKSDRHDCYVDIQIILPGNFNYYFTIDDSDSIDSANGKGYFLVDPILLVGEDEELTMDCLLCQSVLAKSLGPFEEWKTRLEVAKETGYNMIHFTPLQELGVSNSSYSIRNQIKVNPIFSRGNEITFDDVEKFTRWMNKEWKMLTASDLVFNHSSKCSPWLQKHPECAYNLKNSPHLKPAFIVDRILHYFSIDVFKGEWKDKGVPPEVNSENHLKAIKHILTTEVFPKYRIYEFYLCDVDEAIIKFKRHVKGESKPIKGQDLEIIPDKSYKRLKGTIDPDVAMGVFNFDTNDVDNFESRLEDCSQVLREKLHQMNNEKCKQIAQHIEMAIKNFLANVRYRFMASDGPKLPRVSSDEPLMHDYFVLPSHLENSVHNEEKMIFSENAKFVMACNGWVMGDNPLRNFAEVGNDIYLRRELIAWGDSVKLRYGDRPEDCPYLWDFMKKYTEITARFADALRLDNCHSTPLHVAEYMIDAARTIRPNLYVIAELFTSSEATDNLFMNHLGINSLIRESLAAWDSSELGRLVHRYGGQPVGSFIQPQVQPLVNTMAHAIFFDQTHDNPSPIEKRSIYDVLPNTALVSMASCASGSNRGYDELVPHHIHVVNETRLYSNFVARSSDNSTSGLNSGIILGKKVLNELHYFLASSGYNQTFVDQVDGDVVSITRHNPSNHESVILIARTAFSFPRDPSNNGSHIQSLHLPGVVDEIIFEMKLLHREGNEYLIDHEYINGLPDYKLHLVERIKIDYSEMIKVSKSDKHCITINFKNFPPSSVIAIKMSLPVQAKDCILKVRNYLNEFGYLMRSYSGRSLFDKEPSSFREIVEQLNFEGLNRVLYRVSKEEEDDGLGLSSYDIPKYGRLIYCGLQGIAELLDTVRSHNNLGHPLCENLREGNWLCDYIVKRLKVHPSTTKLGEWFEVVFSKLRVMPRYLIPSYFDAVVSGGFIIIRDHALEIMSDFIQQGSSFVQALSLGSIQCCGFVKNAELPPLADDLEAPRPSVLYIDEKARKHQDCLTMSAGLPHFASGFARNWGRDTFIAIRGNLLLTGRFRDARYMILAYGGCLRHGLIPNLLLEGEGARYNCRDAYWWWLQCIQDYCKLAPYGISILKDKVARLYPTDDCEAKITKPEIQLLIKVIQEGLNVHANGLKFRERNAGEKLDMHMSSEGFNNSIGIDWNTGFVYGGNEHNCGTWMDMMGSSEKTGTRGRPATPRDGSAVELVALCYSAVTWLNHMHDEGHYRYSGVKMEGGKNISFSHWAELITNNFEKFFWVHRNPSPDDENYKYINRKGIYKDSVGASQPWCDFQLRPNFPIAMVVAPDLFSPEKAWDALAVAENVLLGPLGMKTLDTSDWNYCGVYDNTNDSDDPKVAKGFNYHQGPEWLWPVGFFFRAKLHFANILDKTEPGTLKKAVNDVKICLTKHYQHLLNSPWKSLPELTNENGGYCHPSCQAQAWSVSTILETLYDMEYMV